MERFAPRGFDSLRISNAKFIKAPQTIISIATAEDLELHSVDFTQSFIQSDRLPEGVNDRFFISPSPGSPRANTSGIVYEVL